jgi:hypothetical protein
MEQAFSKKYVAHMTFKIKEDFIPTDDEFPFQIIDSDEQTPEMVASSIHGLGPEDEDESPTSTPDSLPDVDDLEIDYNGYVSAKVRIPTSGYHFSRGIIRCHIRDGNGELIGKANPNPMLDTSMYGAELEDGSIDRYHANVLAEHIYCQVNDEGYSKSSFDSVTNNRSDPDAMSKIPNAKTTKGWTFCVCIKSGDTMWVDLKDLKEANSI